MADSTIDILTSGTLNYLREYWWDEEFTGFLQETLRPRPGNRILDVGCGTGTAEISIGRLQLSQIRMFGVDQLLDRAIVARHATASRNQQVGFAAADACRLPFVDDAFDATYCVAVLQHVADLSSAIREFARVTRGDGRIVVVEPDNSAQYWYSSVPAGAPMYQARNRFFAALSASSGDRIDAAVGPRLPTLLAEQGIEPLSVRLFPVSRTCLGAPPEDTWLVRARRIRQLIDREPTEPVRAAGTEYLEALARYAEAARAARSAFVEIQNTMLFATVGLKNSGQ